MARTHALRADGAEHSHTSVANAPHTHTIRSTLHTRRHAYRHMLTRATTHLLYRPPYLAGDFLPLTILPEVLDR
jgi:hypothetical protein